MRVIIAIAPNIPLHYSDWLKQIHLFISRCSFSMQSGHFLVLQRLQATVGNPNTGCWPAASLQQCDFQLHSHKYLVQFPKISACGQAYKTFSDFKELLICFILRCWSAIAEYTLWHCNFPQCFSGEHQVITCWLCFLQVMQLMLCLLLCLTTSFYTAVPALSAFSFRRNLKCSKGRNGADLRCCFILVILIVRVLQPSTVSQGKHSVSSNYPQFPSFCLQWELRDIFMQLLNICAIRSLMTFLQKAAPTVPFLALGILAINFM